MKTLRAFSSPAEAGLAKSLLDDHDIVCSLADENSWLYGGAPLAMPVRLLVAEDQFEEAARILKDPPDGENATLTADEKAAARSAVAEHDEAQSRARSNNPWELLVVGLAILIPGILLLLEKRDLAIVDSWYRRRGITFLGVSDVHLLGALVLGAGLFVIFLFFYVRRAIRRDRLN